METLASFWDTFLRVVVRPRTTFVRIEKEEGAVLQGLLILTVRLTAHTKWWLSLVLGLLLLVVYGLTIGLLIR